MEVKIAMRSAIVDVEYLGLPLGAFAASGLPRVFGWRSCARRRLVATYLRLIAAIDRQLMGADVCATADPDIAREQRAGA